MKDLYDAVHNLAIVTCFEGHHRCMCRAPHGAGRRAAEAMGWVNVGGATETHLIYIIKDSEGCYWLAEWVPTFPGLFDIWSECKEQIDPDSVPDEWKSIDVTAPLDREFLWKWEKNWFE